MDDEIKAALESGRFHRCEHCERPVKLYKRRLDLAMTLGLIKVYREVGRGLADIPALFPSRREQATLTTAKHWGLIRQRADLNEPREKRLYPTRKTEMTSYWEITDRGEDFILWRIRVPLRAHTYNDQCWGFSGEKVSIVRCLRGSGFDYEELMNS